MPGESQMNPNSLPDPSILTTEALQREVALVYNRISESNKGLQDLLQARLDAMDVATKLRITIIEDIPDKIDKRIRNLQDLHNEKFEAISQQFSERDIRTDQATRASKEALDAALLAAKELVGVTNDNITKQIDQIAVLIQTGAQATDARITEIKERIDRGPGETDRFHTNETRLNLGVLVGFASVALILIFGVVGILVTGR